MAAGTHEPTSKLLGTAAADIAQDARTCSTRTTFEFLWVVDFPMFEWVEEEKRYEFMHHPFTRRSRATPACSRPTRAACARAPTTWC